MNGALRLSASHRAKVAELRERFPVMVTVRFLIEPSTDMRIGDYKHAITAPPGSRVERRLRFDLREGTQEVTVHHPKHLGVFYNPRFVRVLR